MKNLLKVFFALSIIAVFCFTFMPEQNSAKAIKTINQKTLSDGVDTNCRYDEKAADCVKNGNGSVCPTGCEK